MSNSQKNHRRGGIVHTYQRYDPVKFPAPTAAPPDLVSPAFEHMLQFGSMRELTEEEIRGLEEVVAEPPQKDVFVDATVIATREERIGEFLARC